MLGSKIPVYYSVSSCFWTVTFPDGPGQGFHYIPIFVYRPTNPWDLHATGVLPILFNEAARFA